MAATLVSPAAPAAPAQPAPLAPEGPIFDYNDLTERERQVLAYLLQGKQNGAIARILGIDVYTVKTFVANILRKFKVENRTELIVALYVARQQNRVAVA